VIATLVAVAALGAAPHTLDCAKRVEIGRPLPAPVAARDVIVGPVSFSGLRLIGVEPLRPGDRRDGFWTIKAAPLVRAGAPVTVFVPLALRPHVRLGWAGGDGFGVRFEPCRRSQRAFSYSGSVGRYTGWAGGFLTDAPRCAQIVVRSGRDIWVARVPLGRACP
jgi:hypothetical protein